MGSLFEDKKKKSAPVAPPAPPPVVAPVSVAPPPPAPAAPVSVPMTVAPTPPAAASPSASAQAQQKAEEEVQKLKSQNGRRSTVANRLGALGMADAWAKIKKTKLGS